jgi:hypothetical protein
MMAVTSTHIDAIIKVQSIASASPLNHGRRFSWQENIG